MSGVCLVQAAHRIVSRNRPTEVVIAGGGERRFKQGLALLGRCLVAGVMDTHALAGPSF